MTTTITPSKLQLIDPANGSYVDTWDEPINSNFSVLAAAAGGKTTINVNTATSASSPSVTLAFDDFVTNPQPWTNQYAGQNLEIFLTGTLTYDITIYVPAGISGTWIVYPGLITPGSAKVYFACAFSPTASVVECPIGYTTSVFCDGQYAYYSDLGAIKAGIDKFVVSVLPGTIIAWGGPFSSSTYLNSRGYFACGGALINTADYPDLFAAIGYSWGGSGGQFRLPNLNDGRYLRGADPTGNSGDTGTYQDPMLLSHTHTATSTDAGHVHEISGTGPNANGGGNGWLVNPQGFLTPTNTGFANITTTVNSTGGVENRPLSATVLWAIKY
jgi:microcystin-dependent protein